MINHSNDYSNHYIIKYDEKNSYCCCDKEGHQEETFNSYCNQCHVNLCWLCEKEHENHEIILLRSLFINSDEYFNNMKKINDLLIKFRKIINIIILTLISIFKTFELKNRIIEDIKSGFNMRSRNYIRMLNNKEINEIKKDMNKCLTEITQEKTIIGLFNKIINISNKNYNLNEIDNLYLLNDIKNFFGENNTKRTNKNIKENKFLIVRNQSIQLYSSIKNNNEVNFRIGKINNNNEINQIEINQQNENNEIEKNENKIGQNEINENVIERNKTNINENNENIIEGNENNENRIEENENNENRIEENENNENRIEENENNENRIEENENNENIIGQNKTNENNENRIGQNKTNENENNENNENIIGQNKTNENNENGIGQNKTNENENNENINEENENNENINEENENYKNRIEENENYKNIIGQNKTNENENNENIIEENENYENIIGQNENIIKENEDNENKNGHNESIIKENEKNNINGQNKNIIKRNENHNENKREQNENINKENDNIIEENKEKYENKNENIGIKIEQNKHINNHINAGNETINEQNEIKNGNEQNLNNNENDNNGFISMNEEDEKINKIQNNNNQILIRKFNAIIQKKNINHYKTSKNTKEKEGNNIDNNDLTIYKIYIELIYKIKKKDKEVKLFGINFVKINAEIDCGIYFDNQKIKLQEKFQINEYQLNEFKIIFFAINDIISAQYMFHNCFSLLSFKIRKWESHLPDLSFMFYGCEKLKILSNISKINTENLTNISYMFSYCISLKTIDISGFNLTKVIKMGYLFNSCKSLKEIKGIENLVNENVEEIQHLFCGCSVLEKICALNWNTKNVKNLNCSFKGCFSLKIIEGIENWNTSNIIEMKNSFKNCYSLQDLSGISKWDFSKVVTTKKLFDGCVLLTKVFTSQIKCDNLKDSSFMFRGCDSLDDETIFNILNILENVENINGIFENCFSLICNEMSYFYISDENKRKKLIDKILRKKRPK